MVEILFQVLGELLSTAIPQLLAALIGHGAVEVFRYPRPMNPGLAIVGYLVWGVIFGLSSLLLFPTGFIADPLWRKTNLALTPLLLGALMAWWGARRHGRSLKTIRLDTFGYGTWFALVLTWVRYVGAA